MMPHQNLFGIYILYTHTHRCAIRQSADAYWHSLRNLSICNKNPIDLRSQTYSLMDCACKQLSTQFQRNKTKCDSESVVNYMLPNMFACMRCQTQDRVEIQKSRMTSWKSIAILYVIFDFQLDYCILPLKVEQYWRYVIRMFVWPVHFHWSFAWKCITTNVWSIKWESSLINNRTDSDFTVNSADFGKNNIDVQFISKQMYLIWTITLHSFCMMENIKYKICPTSL